MNIATIIAWISNILFLFGAIFLSKKCIIGWYCQFFANLGYVYQSYVMQNTPLFYLSIVLGLINIFGIYSWRKKNVDSLFSK